jgi:hypothetical protein
MHRKVCAITRKLERHWRTIQMGNKSKKSGPGLSAFVISYVPLLSGTPGSFIDPKDDPMAMEELMHTIQEKLPDGRVAACIWLLKENKPMPVLVIDDMANIVDHLEWWSEGKPVEWFDLAIRNRADKYAVALIPRVNKSVKRWNLAYQLRTGFPPPRSTHYNIAFRSVHFLSGGPSSAYSQISDKIGPDVQVGFLDIKDLNREDPSQTDDQKIRWVGPFTIYQDKVFNQYLDTMLDETQSPNG